MVENPADREARTRALVERYAHLLGIGDWDIDVYFPAPNTEASASSSADPEYERLQLTFVLEEIADTALERHIRHEMVHGVVWPLFHVAEQLAGDDPFRQEMVRLAHETVTTAVEKWPLWDELQRTPGGRS